MDYIHLRIHVVYVRIGYVQESRARHILMISITDLITVLQLDTLILQDSASAVE